MTPGSADNIGKENLTGASLLRTVLPLLFFFVFFLVNGIIGWIVLRSIEEDQDQLVNSLENINRIDELYTEILRAESGQRGYLLTELDSYLAPYQQATSVIDQKLQLLNQNPMAPEQQVRLMQLEGLVQEKLDEMMETIELVTSNRDVEVIQNLFTHRGRNLMQDITSLVLIMESYEHSLMEQRTLISSNNRTTTLVVQVLSNLVGLVMVCLIYALVRKNHLKEQNQSDLENLAKTEFLANLSHEIRTPLTSIIGYTELLQDKYKNTDDEVLAGRLAIINRNSVHLLSLLNDTLDLSKIEAGKMEIEKASMKLAPFLADLVSIVNARAAEQGLTFMFRQDSPLPDLIMTDKTRLRQVLLNLIGNAVKFTDKGNVTLSLALVTVDSQSEKDAEGTHEETATRLNFSVTDTGRGISKKAINAIFDPFVQSGKQISSKIGTGLGLTISNRLANLLGGELTVTSRLKHGSTFTLSIDPGDISNQTLGKLNLENEEIPNSFHKLDSVTGKILVADDFEDIQMLVQSIMTRAGVESHGVNSGQEALECLSGPDASQYCLAILDINMPDMNGDKVISTLRSMGRNIPAIALTAASLQGDKERYLSAGFDGYVGKPISAGKLINEVERILETAKSNACDTDTITTVVIEDNIDARNALCDLLSLLQVNAVGAASLAEARQIVKQHDIELVLTDLHLEKENGIDIASELTGLHPGLRIVLISGDSSILDKDNAIPPEISAVLIKPVSVESLRKIIAKDIGQ